VVRQREWSLLPNGWTPAAVVEAEDSQLFSRNLLLVLDNRCTLRADAGNLRVSLAVALLLAAIPVRPPH
jgi:hypothetical protein